MIHFVITIVSDFSLDDCYTQEKLNYGYSKFGGRRRGWARCIKVDVKMVNCFELQIIPSRFFRFFSPCIKTANQETRNNHEDAFGRPWNSNLDLTGIYAQLFSLRRKTRKYTTQWIIFRLKKNAALESSTDKLSDKHYSKCEGKKLGVLSLLYDIYCNQP